MAPIYEINKWSIRFWTRPSQKLMSAWTFRASSSVTAYRIKERWKDWAMRSLDQLKIQKNPSLIWLKTMWQVPALDCLDRSQGMFDTGQKTECQKSPRSSLPSELSPERNGCSFTVYSASAHFQSFTSHTPSRKVPSDNRLAAVCSDGLLGWCPKHPLSRTGGWGLGST